MGASTSVYGLREKDETYQKHYNVLKACCDAGIQELPKETANYFKCNEPYMSLAEESISIELDITEENTEFCKNRYIDLSSLPESVKIIKVSTCW